jgi:inorganic pyrophosphatase
MDSITTLIFDLNGTLYEKGMPIKGVNELLDTLREREYSLNFVTNTDGRSPNDVYKRVLKMGIKIKPEELLTPVSAFLDFQALNKDKSFHLLVHDDVLKVMEHVIQDSVSPDYVVIGDFCDKTSYETINTAFRAIRNGAEIISLSNTLWYLDQDGENINTGAFVKMFEELCQKKALLLGKPSKSFLEMALRRNETKAEETLVIGDDLLTDIVGGNNLGAKTVQVKTGVYYKNKDNQSILADHLIDDVTQLLDLL